MVFIREKFENTVTSILWELNFILLKRILECGAEGSETMGLVGNMENRPNLLRYQSMEVEAELLYWDLIYHYTTWEGGGVGTHSLKFDNYFHDYD